MSEDTQTDIQPGGNPPEEILPEKKWPAQQRLVGIFKSPRAAMTNVAQNPEYGEAAVAVLLQAILGCIAVGIATGKMTITGPYASTVRSYLTQMIAGTIVFTILLTFLFWAIRAKIIQVLCKGDSAWDFKSAAAVTGYALIPTLLLTIVTMIIVMSMIPTFVLDTANPTAAQAALADFTRQVDAIKLSITVPLAIAGYVWQACLGAHGVKAGTKGSCSYAAGFVVFFVIGLIDLLLTFL